VFVAQRDTTKFTTRHTASGILSHVDGTANILGFLPQDILGKKIMEFYHPEDMSLLKEVYETIMVKGQKAGASFCGKPYRFLAHNGCYITVETEWSSFVNPWSHHLEFVIGYHRVLKGPSNSNVLAAASSENCVQFSGTITNESRKIQDEILKMLTEPITRPSDTVKQQVSKRCQVLASFMETLMDEVTQSGTKGDLKLDLPQESDLTFSERDSVMLGDISPHHDYFDSKSSSETPPSYNQLNYSENLQRFFDSRPVTTTGEPEQMKMDQSETEQSSRVILSPAQCFGQSGGSESAGNMSSASNVNMESVTNTSTGTSHGSYVSPMLTEALICKHNEDMEKLIIKRHKVSRTTGKSSDKYKKGIERNEQHAHGLKRSGSHSWEGEAFKTSKHQHTVEVQKVNPAPFLNQVAPRPVPTANVDLWPPFSVSVTSNQNTLTTSQATHFTPSNMFPTLYYIPQNLPDQRCGQMQTLQYMPGMPGMPSMLYQPMVYQHPSSFYQMQFPQSSYSQPMYLNDQVFNQSLQFDKNIAVPVLQIPTPIGSGSVNLICQRPLSQATSVKADMGSTSASVANRV
jgi:period circadian protein 2